MNGQKDQREQTGRSLPMPADDQEEYRIERPSRRVKEAVEWPEAHVAEVFDQLPWLAQ